MHIYLGASVEGLSSELGGLLIRVSSNDHFSDLGKLIEAIVLQSCFIIWLILKNHSKLANRAVVRTEYLELAWHIGRSQQGLAGVLRVFVQDWGISLKYGFLQCDQKSQVPRLIFQHWHSSLSLSYFYLFSLDEWTFRNVPYILFETKYNVNK